MACFHLHDEVFVLHTRHLWLPGIIVEENFSDEEVNSYLVRCANPLRDDIGIAQLLNNNFYTVGGLLLEIGCIGVVLGKDVVPKDGLLCQVRAQHLRPRRQCFLGIPRPLHSLGNILSQPMALRYFPILIAYLDCVAKDARTEASFGQASACHQSATSGPTLGPATGESTALLEAKPIPRTILEEALQLDSNQVFLFNTVRSLCLHSINGFGIKCSESFYWFIEEHGEDNCMNYFDFPNKFLSALHNASRRFCRVCSSFRVRNFLKDRILQSGESAIQTIRIRTVKIGHTYDAMHKILRYLRKELGTLSNTIHKKLSVWEDLLTLLNSSIRNEEGKKQFALSLCFSGYKESIEGVSIIAGTLKPLDDEPVVHIHSSYDVLRRERAVEIGNQLADVVQKITEDKTKQAYAIRCLTAALILEALIQDEQQLHLVHEKIQDDRFATDEVEEGYLLQCCGLQLGLQAVQVIHLIAHCSVSKPTILHDTRNAIISLQQFMLLSGLRSVDDTALGLDYNAKCDIACFNWDEELCQAYQNVKKELTNLSILPCFRIEWIEAFMSPAGKLKCKEARHTTELNIVAYSRRSCQSSISNLYKQLSQLGMLRLIDRIAFFEGLLGTTLKNSSSVHLDVTRGENQPAMWDKWSELSRDVPFCVALNELIKICQAVQLTIHFIDSSSRWVHVRREKANKSQHPRENGTLQSRLLQLIKSSKEAEVLLEHRALDPTPLPLDTEQLVSAMEFALNQIDAINQFWLVNCRDSKASPDKNCTSFDTTIEGIAENIALLNEYLKRCSFLIQTATGDSSRETSLQKDEHTSENTPTSYIAFPLRHSISPYSRDEEVSSFNTQSALLTPRYNRPSAQTDNWESKSSVEKKRRKGKKRIAFLSKRKYNQNKSTGARSPYDFKNSEQTTVNSRETRSIRVGQMEDGWTTGISKRSQSTEPQNVFREAQNHNVPSSGNNICLAPKLLEDGALKAAPASWTFLEEPSYSNESIHARESYLPLTQTRDFARFQSPKTVDPDSERTDSTDLVPFNEIPGAKSNETSAAPPRSPQETKQLETVHGKQQVNEKSTLTTEIPSSRSRVHGIGSWLPLVDKTIHESSANCVKGCTPEDDAGVASRMQRLDTAHFYGDKVRWLQAKSHNKNKLPCGFSTRTCSLESPAPGADVTEKYAVPVNIAMTKLGFQEAQRRRIERRHEKKSSLASQRVVGAPSLVTSRRAPENQPILVPGVFSGLRSREIRQVPAQSVRPLLANSPSRKDPQNDLSETTVTARHRYRSSAAHVSNPRNTRSQALSVWRKIANS